MNKLIEIHLVMLEKDALSYFTATCISSLVFCIYTFSSCPPVVRSCSINKEMLSRLIDQITEPF